MYSADTDKFRFENLTDAFSGKRVFITGAGKDGGIGQAFALGAGLNGAESVGVHFHRSYQDGFDPEQANKQERDARLSRLSEERDADPARFILQALESKSLTLSEPADKETLIRRLSLDLTGLPPTPEEVDTFLADTSPEATDQLVERLLASPRFGERLATVWLDAALRRSDDASALQKLDAFSLRYA